MRLLSIAKILCAQGFLVWSLGSFVECGADFNARCILSPLSQNSSVHYGTLDDLETELLELTYDS